ncbi:hypothetical protein [Methylobacterium sp. Leaf106]|uniref:hypothetical protein n=1 Tax=Methylobacterium sp. Leaf106 TaxID=1736255 RepID=UPI0012E71469|nr:hypothetical protein [Methylobacterium sp. Leaf106]
MSAIDELRELEGKLRSRLKQNPDFLAWTALRKAIDEVIGATGHIPASHVNVKLQEEASQQNFAPLSQSEAAMRAIKQAGVPVYIGELLPKVIEQGVSVGGSNKEVNLSSALSRDKRLRSVRWNGKYYWWLKDQLYPGETVADQAAAHDDYDVLGNDPVNNNGTQDEEDNDLSGVL